jgi:hypothetical protein
VIDSRKHPEYAANHAAILQMSEVFFKMNANTPLTGVREQLKPVIDYFEKIKTTYTTTCKHDRKMRYASYFNLAILYFYLDEPDLMMRECLALELNDYDARDGKMLARAATRLKNQFEQTGIYTRHFTINTETLTGPPGPSAAKLR